MLKASRAESIWAHPATPALVLLTLINLFNYLDRYILIALAPTIKRELALSDTQVGLLATAFMISYFLISPVFGWMGDRYPRYRLMSVGVGLWSAATVACGRAQGFGALLGARLCIGVGEAAYGSISPSVLSDLYPKSIRGKIFAVFFMAIPVGSALGFVLGGLLEKFVGWRSAFFVAGVPGILLAAALWFLREPRRGAYDDPVAAAPAEASTWSYAVLARNPNYVLTVAGYTAYTFVLGGIAAWIPHYIERYLGVSAADGNMAFGAITVVAGLLGTLIGGAWADRWAKRGTDGYLKLAALSMFVALPIFAATLTVNSFGAFQVLVFFLEFLFFLSTSPVNAQVVNCVQPHLRATANAASIFIIHLLGDGISMTLTGVVADQTNLRFAMWLFLPVTFLSGAFWAWKFIFKWEPLPWPVEAFKLPKAQCHRGHHPAGVQENTIEAFRGAARAGAEMIELDVHLSREGVAVVVHDEDIQRISGRGERVDASSAADLQAWAKVPALVEVLRDPECARLLVNVELKSKKTGDFGLETAVAKAVRDAGAEKRVLFSSFNPFALRRISKLLPNAPRALLVTRENEPGNHWYLKNMMLAFLARPHMLNLDWRSYSDGIAKDLVSRHVPVALWTVEDPSAARNFLAKGAESIISPNPKIV